jgi:hypothetical protein
LVLDAKGEVSSQFDHVGSVYLILSYLAARLSIYLRLWTCTNYLCGVMYGDVVNLEPFKICKT